MNNEYQCSRCGDYIEHRQDYKRHMRTCGTSKLDQFIQDDESKAFFKLNTAIRLNDYDNDNNKAESSQRNLRNKRIGQQNLNKHLKGGE